MRINYGCGRHVLAGYTNVDAVVNPLASKEPEILFEMQFEYGRLVEKTPLPDECSEELQAMHLLEHFYRWDADAVIEEWKRLLCSGGRLVLELPNIELAARNLLASRNDQMCMWPMYGDPSWKSPFMCHRWGWRPTTVTALLAEHGFVKIKILAPQTHKQRVDRDMRVEAVKP